MNAGEGRKKSPRPRTPRAGFRDTISVLRSGRFIAAIALVAYSIAGSRKRRTLASTSRQPTSSIVQMCPPHD